MAKVNPSLKKQQEITDLSKNVNEVRRPLFES
jgi:hypothetical protein